MKKTLAIIALLVLVVAGAITAAVAVSRATHRPIALAAPGIPHVVKVPVTPSNPLVGNAAATALHVKDWHGQPQTLFVKSPLYLKLARHPAFTNLPVGITPYQGETLTTTTGTWSNCGTSPGYSGCTFAYQWQRCNSSGASCANESTGGTSSSYTTVAGDVTNTLRVVVTATNSSGSVSEDSAVTGVVTSTGGAFSISVSHTGSTAGDFVNGDGDLVKVDGFDATGTEDQCVENSGVIGYQVDGTDGAGGTVTAHDFATWGANIVRVPLNEDCWLGINGEPLGMTSSTYQTAIENWVSALNAAGIYAELDLHWNAPGTTQATGQQEMADEDHSVTFWTSVATAFAATPGVLFDLYNEPALGYGYGSGADTTADWTCWLEGSESDSSCASIAGMTTAGMQPMEAAIRNAGATQVIVLASDSWAGIDCGTTATTGSGCTMLSYLPVNPLTGSTDTQLAFSAHAYADMGSSGNDWDGSLSALEEIQAGGEYAQMPLLVDEFGSNASGGDSSSSYPNSVYEWAFDQNDVGALEWTWQPSVCNYQGFGGSEASGSPYSMSSCGSAGNVAEADLQAEDLNPLDSNP